MAIEPIGTMTAMQVQSTVKAKSVEAPQNQSSKSSKVNEFETAQEASSTPKLEDATAIVAKAGETNNGDGKGKDDQSSQNNDALHKAVQEINKNLKNSKAVFGIHDGTNRVTIKIVDKDTDKVIKELPPEKTLDMIAKIWEMADIMKGSGWLVDEKK